MAMLPPLNLSTAKDNPKFKALYHNLAANIVNPDGSVKVSSEVAKQQASTAKELAAAQHVAAKTAILRYALTQLYSQQLPTELQDLITLIAYPPTPDNEARLGDFLSISAPDPSSLGPLVSEELSPLSSQLLQIADPSAKQHCTTAHVLSRKNELGKSKARLHNERLSLAGAACTLLETQQEIFTTTIRALESVKYGSVARADTAKSAYLAMAAEGLDEKLRVMKLEVLQSIYDPDVRAAIQVYGNHLTQLRVRLKARERSAKEKLDQYDEVGRSMGQIAERYVGLVQEVESIKAQVRRLERKT